MKNLPEGFSLWDSAIAIQGDARRFGIEYLRDSALMVMALSSSRHVSGESYFAAVGRIMFKSLFDLAIFSRRLFEEAALLDHELPPAMCVTPGTDHFMAVGGTSNGTILKPEKLRFVLNAIVHSTNLSIFVKKITTDTPYGENTIITAVGATTDQGREVVFCPNAFARTCLAFSIAPPAPASSASHRN